MSQNRSRKKTSDRLHTTRLTRSSPVDRTLKAIRSRRSVGRSTVAGANGSPDSELRYRGNRILTRNQRRPESTIRPASSEAARPVSSHPTPPSPGFRSLDDNTCDGRLHVGAEVLRRGVDRRRQSHECCGEHAEHREDRVEAVFRRHQGQRQGDSDGDADESGRRLELQRPS